MYSATEAREDAADAVSQSLSVLLLGFRLSVGKASSDSTLRRDRGRAGGSQARTLSVQRYSGPLARGVRPEQGQSHLRQEGPSAGRRDGRQEGQARWPRPTPHKHSSGHGAEPQAPE